MSPAALFAYYNRRYFGGRLPVYTIRRRLPGRLKRLKLFHSADDARGYSWAGYCDTRRRIIYLRQRHAYYPESILRATLVHEMVHAAGVVGHDTDFFEMLLSLADRGCRAALDAMCDEADVSRAFALARVRQYREERAA